MDHTSTSSGAPRRRVELLVLTVVVALVAAFAIAWNAAGDAPAANAASSGAPSALPVQDTQQAPPSRSRHGNCPHHQAASTSGTSL